MSVRAPEPVPFDGKAKNLEPFLRQCLDNIHNGGFTTFPTDHHKSTYIAGFMTKHDFPRAWLEGLRNLNDTLMDDFPGFLAALRGHFSDPDARGTAARRLEKLKQTGMVSV
ncbi:hypothetical protein CALCODRAFT_488640 [Calocera cornea HHB12733]|uniref:DUF4939 domain-containing protein n=1 Tax=Calocera cornea HHB12733 TaxID=1353952 RepID=A0A165CB73_9BASI|nr:hypothetical protein CALCODRAFT_488640 [Calocera cornea HHB12733]